MTEIEPEAVTVVIPCRNEAESIGPVIDALPAGYTALVVDNGSTDGTAEIARRAGARVVTEPRPGYGSAVHAGIAAARTEVVCTVDGDGSMDPGELVPLVAAVRDGADLAVGRRRPDPAEVWPWHARLGSALVAARLRGRYGLPLHDIGPMRAVRREAVLGLGVVDRRSGYPVELLARAGAAGWRVVEHPVRYGPRTGGRSKVSGSITGSMRATADFLRAAR
ncbi:glycosyl transferase [Tsukamurella pulmonis]|uniref:Glycosyl transferase family 2 n=1 Tax=Tsukamurella pulmonis TaxID=47312 RepID=A0A1H1C185_9ACTN|nr:glycosyltransferase family 2 protein [Tsukamurella pulmonis]KXO90110.1 glycosyltransferase [Tsukamurella pulmonis]KXP11362.1 glycosyltransferase [Tsukamurella pulmonis]RDH10590.1 glycosyltransferase family 2 protein [Tsukamurella pulmonis]SDQ57934.1 Glycosyl transferase family 2 [Tsukamurella pulmonis]SUP24380.1 Undecaprenyl-phosphate 4-deoxy-4-formamido-L-arabinose transferase [Tsukamurella pulmonis]